MTSVRTQTLDGSLHPVFTAQSADWTLVKWLQHRFSVPVLKSYAAGYPGLIAAVYLSWCTKLIILGNVPSQALSRWRRAIVCHI